VTTVDADLYRLIPDDGRGNTVRCGRCLKHFDTVRGWARHFVRKHGTNDELERRLPKTLRGIPRAKWGTWGGDRKKAWRGNYQQNRKYRSAWTQRWFKAHPDIRRRMEKTKLSQAPGARENRKRVAWLRDIRVHCGRCGSPIEVRRFGNHVGASSVCPRHGRAWTWRPEDLLLFADYHVRAARTRRRLGNYGPAMRKAWETRRARGNVAESVAKLWKTRYERYGPSGMTRSRTGRPLGPPSRSSNPNLGEGD
jgi:hypothetical protein